MELFKFIAKPEPENEVPRVEAAKNWAESAIFKNKLQEI